MGTNNVGGMIGEGAKSLVNTLLILLIIVLLLIGALVYFGVRYYDRNENAKISDLAFNFIYERCEATYGQVGVNACVDETIGDFKVPRCEPEPQPVPEVRNRTGKNVNSTRTSF